MSGNRFKIKDNETNVVTPDLKNLKRNEIYNSPNNAIKSISEGVESFLSADGPLSGLSDKLGGVSGAMTSINEAVGGVQAKVGAAINQAQSAVQGVSAKVSEVKNAVQGQINNAQQFVNDVQSKIKGGVEQLQNQINSVVAPVEVVIRQTKGYGEQLRDLSGVPARVLSDISNSSLGGIPGVDNLLKGMGESKAMGFLNKASSVNLLDYSSQFEKIQTAKLLDKVLGEKLYSGFDLVNDKLNMAVSLTNQAADVGIFDGVFDKLTSGLGSEKKNLAAAAIVKTKIDSGDVVDVSKVFSDVKHIDISHIVPDYGASFYEAVRYSPEEKRKMLASDPFIYEGPYDLDKRIKEIRESRQIIDSVKGGNILADIYREHSLNDSIDLNDLSTISVKQVDKARASAAVGFML